MNLHSSRSSLLALTQELGREWEQTKEFWRDSQSRDFEQRYLEELRAGVNSAASSLERLDQILTRIRKDCE